MARKKKTYIDHWTGEVVKETRRKMRKDEYTDIFTGKVKRRKKGESWLF